MTEIGEINEALIPFLKAATHILNIWSILIYIGMAALVIIGIIIIINIIWGD